MMKHPIVLLAFTTLCAVCSAFPFKHDWSTVQSFMGMHGKYFTLDEVISSEDVEFMAEHYSMITTGTSCKYNDTSSPTMTIEQSVHALAARIKTANPNVPVGMYYRTPDALEVAECSGFASEWNSHPEWRLKDDSGKVIQHGSVYYYDYSQKAVQEFFATVIVNVTKAVLPSTGKPLLDYVYLDGGCSESSLTEYAPGIGPQRSAEIVAGKYATFASIQSQLDAAGFGQGIILNAMDSFWSAAAGTHAGTGFMFDHWSILQFLNRPDGTFNVTAMEQGIELASSSLLSNTTVQIKGWPGPIIQQRDKYPSNIPTPTTSAEFQAMGIARFNSELALYLTVANEFSFWVYSFFWSFWDYVPGNPESTIPMDFFPEAKCPLGAPLGPASHIPNTNQYKRQFEHASVFVDLNNRTASAVHFTNC